MNNNTSNVNDTLIVIPARMASTRLSNKMLSDIGGKPLIVHTYESVISAQIGDVIVACDDNEIAKAINRVGGIAVLTDPALPSGTDRVYAAYKSYDMQKKYKFIINVQGDMPFVEPKIILEAIKLIHEKNYDISTVATKVNDDSYLLNQVVKPIVAFEKRNNNLKENKKAISSIGKALYFSRSPIPFGGPFYKHIGIYGFRSETIERFVSLPQSPLEKSEKLEQLRALENGMSIGIAICDLEYPISVDTSDDLEKARNYFSKKN